MLLHDHISMCAACHSSTSTAPLNPNHNSSRSKRCASVSSCSSWKSPHPAAANGHSPPKSPSIRMIRPRRRTTCPWRKITSTTAGRLTKRMKTKTMKTKK
uniref:(northern house mosquito) hypothetical protein n=1 Tax=Culex pipiens TaxID=7175 RepID=A0A8D8C1R6_CULPI